MDTFSCIASLMHVITCPLEEHQRILYCYERRQVEHGCAIKLLLMLPNYKVINRRPPNQSTKTSLCQKSAENHI